MAMDKLKDRAVDLFANVIGLFIWACMIITVIGFLTGAPGSGGGPSWGGY